MPAGLVELDLGLNPLQCLPPTLAKASELQRLCLRGTDVQQRDLAAMRATLERLPHLCHLDLANNALRSLPPGSYLSRKQWISRGLLGFSAGPCLTDFASHIAPLRTPTHPTHPHPPTHPLLQAYWSLI
jgi:Leucine-rich repeat (LRR) protein